MIFLSIHCGHNATVGLSIDGQLVTMISEERITRIKNYTGFPKEAFKFIKKKYLNNELEKIDKFIFIDQSGQALNYIYREKFVSKKFSDYSWKIEKNFFKNFLFYNLLGKKFINFLTITKRYIRRELLDKFINKKKILLEFFKLNPDLIFDLNKTIFYNHHEIHALSFGYFFDEISEKKLIFTMDGEGDNISSAVFSFDKKIKKISENSNNVSLGYFYAQATAYLGLKPLEHEFKVMGMAPYGKQIDVDRIYNKIKNLIFLNNKGQFESNVVSSLFKYEFENFFKFEKFENICGAVQKITENLILDWINFWISKTSIKNIVVSGGVFMNIKACKKILESNLVDNLFVVPSASDESLPIGALWKANIENNKKIQKIDNLYLGREFKDEIENFIKINKIENKFKITKFENFYKLNEKVSELLRNNEIIARCCGKEEWGARALGNRSIICNPSIIENVKTINETIKSRDYWMPFSPTILDIDKINYLKNIKNFKSNYMTCLFDSTVLGQKHLKAAIHPVDYTLRPQIITIQNNKEYYDLILKFKNKTGIGAVLNTSFNLHGEPNVGDYRDAIHTLENSKLKFLILENYLLEKKN